MNWLSTTLFAAALAAADPARPPMPPITQPVMFNTAEADKILDGISTAFDTLWEGYYLQGVTKFQLGQMAQAENLLQAGRILEALADGVAVVNPDLRITWANRTFETWCGGPVLDRGFYDALGSPEILGPDYCPFHNALAGKDPAVNIHKQLRVEYSLKGVAQTAVVDEGKPLDLPEFDEDESAVIISKAPAPARADRGDQFP